MKRTLLSLSCLLLFGLQSTLADSPLTSTLFHDAYQDVPAVKQALKEKKLTPKLARYLKDSSQSLDKRLAVVSALGWRFEGQNNAQEFSRAVLGTGDTWFFPNTWEGMSADHLIILAYLQALDDYFDVKDEYEMAAQARRAAPENSALSVIASLIEAQNIMEMKDTEQWPRVWAVAKPTLEMRSKPRFRDEALAIIKKYMIIYED